MCPLSVPAAEHIAPPSAGLRLRFVLSMRETFLRRSPGRDTAPVQKSERTSSQRKLHLRTEDSVSGRLVTGCWPQALTARQEIVLWNPLNFLFPSCFTLAASITQVRSIMSSLLIGQARKLLSMEFDNTADGWRKFLEAIKAFPKIAFTIETSCGADVEHLMDAGLPVYPINPKSAQALPGPQVGGWLQE